MEAILERYHPIVKAHGLQKAAKDKKTGKEAKAKARLAAKTVGKCACGCDGPGYFPLFTIVVSPAKESGPTIVHMKDLDETSLYHSLVLAIQNSKVEYAAGLEPNDAELRARLAVYYCKVGWAIVSDVKPSLEDEAVKAFVENLEKEYAECCNKKPPKPKAKKEKESAGPSAQLLSGDKVPSEFQADDGQTEPPATRKRSHEEDEQEDDDPASFGNLPIDIQDALKILSQRYLVDPKNIHERLEKKYAAKRKVGQRLQAVLQNMSAEDLNATLKKVKEMKAEKKAAKKAKTTDSA
jgi:hypothetical protein